MSCAEQLDLFARMGANTAAASAPARPPAPAPTELDDAALLAAIPASGLADGPTLCAEAGRRRLTAAVPVLEDYCRRFAGFGLSHALPEQVAALQALAAIGGPDAAHSVAMVIARCWVQGPTLAVAAKAAARLGSRLPPEVVLSLLRHADPGVRADACRLARAGADVIATLIDLLGDLHGEVRLEAACALGRLGCPEALPTLSRALREAPGTNVIEAVSPIADQECIVLLGRLARTSPKQIAEPARAALEAIDHPLASRLLERLGNP